MGLQDQEKIKEGCETGFRGDTEPCQCPWKSSIDRPFIVLAETKPSKRHIPVWARYSLEMAMLLQLALQTPPAACSRRTERRKELFGQHMT